MPYVESHAPGSFCWVELATSDQAGAKSFYQTLLGWDAADIPMGPGETYTIFKKAGRDAAAGYRQRPDSGGAPPNWQVYVRVASADQAAAQATALGGTVLAPSLDVPDAGRMAVLQDPTGAVFAVWEPRRNAGLGVIDEPGAFCWAELMAKDLPRAATFYKSLFGWGTKDDPRYTEWTLGDRSIGGMIEIQKDWGEVPPHWLVYFQVDDCDASVEKAKSLGGKLAMGPQDFPGVGRIALLHDPQGAAFYLIKLTGLGH
jgi:predicted enzyme related to lactoylglutathione lyase